MNLGLRAIRWYEEHEPPGRFAEVLSRCFLHGLVVKRPEMVLLAEEVFTGGRPSPVIRADKPPDSWFVYLLVIVPGSSSPYDWRLLAPWPHQYVAYKHRGKMRVHRWDCLGRDIGYQAKHYEPAMA